jgi:hypothetical protein
MRFSQRRLKWTIIAFFVIVAYEIAFFTLVGTVHITWGLTPGPRPPEYMLYVSRDSVTTNRIAHIVFAPLNLQNLGVT